MKWRIAGDNSTPIITATGHVNSHHRRKGCDRLPETCVMFEFKRGMETFAKAFDTEILTEDLPCFLQKTTCLKLKGND